MYGASTAITTSISTKAPATRARCCLRNLRQNSVQGVRTASGAVIGDAAAAGVESSVMPASYL
ncbi:hypothetical protein D3C86_1797770 [compost metagenome]